MKRRPWTPEEDQILREVYPVSRTKDLARALRRSETSVSSRAGIMGLNKHPAYLRCPLAGRTDGNRGGHTRFKPGHKTWNSGMKGWKAGGRSAETRFRPGNRPPNWQPIGTAVKTADGYWKRKVRDDAPKGMSRKNWEFLHIMEWEKHHGPVPKGHAVIFKDGNRDNINIENLEIVSRGGLMRRNAYHNYPKEIAQVIQLRGAIKRQINKRKQA